MPHVLFCRAFPFYDSWSNWLCLLIFPHSCSFPAGAPRRIFCGPIREALCISVKAGLLMPAIGVEELFKTRSLWV